MTTHDTMTDGLGASHSSEGLGPLPAHPTARTSPGNNGWTTAEKRAILEYAAQQVAAERERLCAAIKAADDKASESDYMLDSDDCSSVIRGTWNPGA